MMKICKTCGAAKDLMEFHVKRDCRLGVAPHCKPCTRAYKNERTKTREGFLSKKASDKKYEHTLRGYIMRQYRNMKSRVTGVQKKKAHLYQGLEIMPKRDYYRLCLSSQKYILLFKAFAQSGWQMALAPSVDRIDSSRGYTAENIQFLTHAENSRKGSQAKKRINRQALHCANWK